MLNLSAKDLRALSKPALVLIVIAALATAAVLSSDHSVKAEQAEVKARESQLIEARNRVQQSDQEKRMIEHYVAPYKRLEQSGIVGDEQRISWIDALRTANSEADLYGVEYEVGPQQPYSLMNEVNAGSLAVHQSVMKLRFGVLHEGDLARFFQVLAAQKVGSFSVNSCTLERLPVNLAVPVNQPTLEVECEVAWITIGGTNPEKGKS